MNNFVKSSDYGIKGVNYYWTRRDRYNISEAELREAGVTDGEAYIHRDLVKPLQEANRRFRELGYEIQIDEGYRPPELYRLVVKKRNELEGKDVTASLFNSVAMPHKSGMVVDICLLDLRTGQKLWMRDGKDDPAGFFVGFYRGKDDEQSRTYQARQDMMIGVMEAAGFKLGSKNEYWHFEYR